MVLVRVIGWLLFAAGGLLDLWLMLSSSVIVSQRHGLMWTVLGWVFFPVGIFALPIAAGLGTVMLVVYLVTGVGAALAQAGKD